MLRLAISAIAALGLSAVACGLETSGLLLGGQGGSPSSGGDGAVSTGSDEAGGGVLVIGGLSDGAASDADAGMSDGLVADGGLVEAAPAIGPDGSASSDGSLGVSPQDGSPQDGGVTGPDAPDTGGAVFACGNQLLCALPGQTCCAGSSNRGGGGPNTLTCENGPTCSDPSATSLRCTAAADCATQVCCLSQQSSPATSQCSSQCNGGDVQLCDPSAQNTGCGGNAACLSQGGKGSTQLPNGIGTCG